MFKRTIYTILFFVYCFFMLWLAAKPAHAQSFFKNVHLVETPTTQATAGATTTLTKDSQTVQRFTGTSSQTVVLPNATTLSNGMYFLIANDTTTGVLTINNATPTLLTTVLATNSVSIRLISNASAAGLWTIETNYTALPASSISGIVPLANGGTALSNVASQGGAAYGTSTGISLNVAGSSGQYLRSNATSPPTWSAVSVSGEITGVLPLANGGTNNANVASQGGVGYGTATGISISTAGASGTFLKSAGTGVPNYAAITLSGDVSGILPLTNGGTNANITASHGGLAYSTATTISIGPVASVGTVLLGNGAAAYSNTAVGVSGTWLKSNGTGIPTFQAIQAATDISGILPLANGGTNNATVAVNGGAAYGTSTGISLTAVGVSGTVLTSTGAGIPLWYKPATVIGTCKWTGTGSCQYTTGNTGGVYTEFGADTDCNNPSVTGSASAPGTKIPACNFSSLPEGQYVVLFNGLMGPETSSVTASQQFRISDGSTTSGQCQSSANSTNSAEYECDSLNGYFSYTTAQSNVSFRPVSASSSDSNDPQLVVNNSTTRQMEMIIIYYPR